MKLHVPNDLPEVKALEAYRKPFLSRVEQFHSTLFYHAAALYKKSETVFYTQNKNLFYTLVYIILPLLEYTWTIFTKSRYVPLWTTLNKINLYVCIYIHVYINIYIYTYMD